LALVAFPLMGAAKFQEIVKDFKITRLNRLSTAVFRVSEFMNDYPIVPIVLIGLGVLAFLIPMSFYMHRLFVPGARRPRFTTAWPWLAWRLPVLHGAQVDKAMAEVCGLLAEATRAGTPLPVAVRQAMVLPINIGFKEKLGVFLEGLNQGKSAADAAAKARLPELLVGMLQPMSEASVGVSGAAMFEFLERYYRQRFSRTILMLRAAMEPLLVLLFGAIVLGMVLAVLQPVRQILESVMANGAGGVL
jgi:type II secretory pathway component PulF